MNKSFYWGTMVGVWGLSFLTVLLLFREFDTLSKLASKAGGAVFAMMLAGYLFFAVFSRESKDSIGFFVTLGTAFVVVPLFVSLIYWVRALLALLTAEEFLHGLINIGMGTFVLIAPWMAFLTLSAEAAEGQPETDEETPQEDQEEIIPEE